MRGPVGVFAIDVEQCERCGGAVRIIACIEDGQVIEKIPRHLGLGDSRASRGDEFAAGVDEGLSFSG